MNFPMRLGDKGQHIRDLQALLNRRGASLLADGDFGPKTEAAVIVFQGKVGLVVDGIAGLKTWDALNGFEIRSLLKEADLVQAAERLGVELAAIKAVNEVESRGAGFFSPGKPAILFERHIMYRQLSRVGEGDNAQAIADQVNGLVALWPQLVNPRPGGYAGNLAEYPRLARAKMLDANAAIESTSWGLFQIMGFHWQRLGYASAEAFELTMCRSETNQLDAFVRFIEADPALHRALKQHKWAAFAKGYNGPAYARNLYDVKLSRAFERYQAQHSGSIAA